MKLAINADPKNPVFIAQAKQLQEFVLGHGIPFNPNDDFTEFDLFDIQDIPAARQTNIEPFNTATSSATLHARLLAGCNLPAVGRLWGNTSFIVYEMRAEFLEAVTAAKLVDATRAAAYGIFEGFYVEGSAQLKEHRLSRVLYRSGIQPMTAGEGAGAAVINGAAPLDDGLQLPVTTQCVIGRDQGFLWRLRHNGPADLGAALSTMFTLHGLRITHMQGGK